MKITVLDRTSLGDDTPLSIFDNFGEVIIYDSTSSDELIEHISDSDVIILNKVKISRDAIFTAQNLKLICVFATGYDNIDVSAAKERGVAVCNVPGYSTDSVALYTMATTLALYTHLSEYNDYVKDGSYTESGVANKLTPVYHEISGKTWGIIGYGNIGKAVGRIATAMGAHLIVNKRTPVGDCECVDLETLCKRSDIITVHCPLNDGTRGIINKQTISLMKKDVVLVNEARGAVLCEEDVAQAVEEGRIAAFGCDVYSSEPFPKTHPYYRIMNRKNVILTPHAAWGSYEARARCISIIADNIEAFVCGEIKNRVDI